MARWLTAEASSRGEIRIEVSGVTLREAFDNPFLRHPILRDYIVDQRGALRHHVVAFIDNESVGDKASLAEPLTPASEIYVFQALSGG
ncbi:MAG: MoaD/ThiS family protein [Gemmataceae bacterium]|nr:MoaD/ThiS family protein [Gemmataceae bacterium]